MRSSILAIFDPFYFGSCIWKKNVRMIVFSPLNVVHELQREYEQKHPMIFELKYLLLETFCRLFIYRLKIYYKTYSI